MSMEVKTSNVKMIKIKKRYYGKDKINSRELQLFEKNIFSDLFIPELVGKNKIIYTAPNSISLNQYLKKELTLHRLYNIIVRIIEVVKKVENNGLYIDNLVLDAKQIHVREITGELYFLYEPIKNTSKHTNLYGFLGDILEIVKVHDKATEIELSKIKEFLKDVKNYKLQVIEQFILNNYPQIYQQIKSEKIIKKEPDSGFIASSKLSYHNHYENNIRKNIFEDGTTILQPELGTTILSDYDEGTTILSADFPSAKIYRKSNSEAIYINRQEFLIGKDSSCDFCISDNKAVSRKHASIIYKENKYVIRDENSTNHTYLNNEIVSFGTEKELKNLDLIRLGNEEFEFYIE